MNILFDTNLLVDYLSGDKKAKKILNSNPDAYISRITWMEVLIGAKDTTETALLKNFLQHFHVVECDEAVSLLAIDLRKNHRLKLPDAIIWASAKHINACLFTRDKKDFPAHAPDVKIV